MEKYDNPGEFDDESTSDKTGETGKEAEKELKRLAEMENKQICFWKTAVVGILVLAGTAISVGINIYLKDQQEHEIDHNFDLFANTIEDTSKLSFQAIFDAIQGFSNSLTSEATEREMTFPNVTFESFEVYGQQARKSSGVEAFLFAPILDGSQLLEWNEYSLQHEDWVEKSRQVGNQIGDSVVEYPTNDVILPFVYEIATDEETGELTGVPATGEGRFTPLWQLTPPPVETILIKVDTLSTGSEEHPQIGVERIQDTILGSASEEVNFIATALLTEGVHNEIHAGFPLSNQPDQPHVLIATPVFDSLEETREHVGDIVGIFTLETFLVNLLPEGVRGLYVVVSNTCGQLFTFELNGNQARYVGEGDQSDPNHRNRVRTVVFDSLYKDISVHEEVDESCIYSFDIYASESFEEIFSDDLPLIFAVVIAAIFFVMAIVFGVYDTFVRRRNMKVTTAAVRSTAIVDSLFPSNVRERLYAGETGDGPKSSTARLKRFVDREDTTAENGSDEDIVLKSQPIADLFPDTTVMFADIAGFTSWSSMREPSQVFTLLETVYRAFDRIAKHRRVYKVETVGDCYVSCAGCPTPVKHHAVVMSRFALECLATMEMLTKELEVSLGPDTADLHMRIGLHSGAVTAGVLRGERARFQLFGDTMNTAARVESTGQKGRVHVSQETADLLVASGKEHWLVKREEKVHAKGKGEMQTYFLKNEDRSFDNKSTASSEPISPPISEQQSELWQEKAGLDPKTERLIDWNVDVLWRLLKKVVARRIGNGDAGKRVTEAEESMFDGASGTVLSEVQEIISLPTFNPTSHKNEPDPEKVEIDDVVKSELRNFVASIASMYRDNPFHSFQHASHVTMSVVKLLSRVVAPTDELDGRNVASGLHDHSYGITSDPLTQFACVFSALIHDCDHPGVPNAQLVKEKNHLAEFYNHQSVAEQNSVDLAWSLLLNTAFPNLRAAIYGTTQELTRFRQLVVNSVMATDIVDKELKALRNKRWEMAFSSGDGSTVENERDATNRKATIVIEHLIQASDVAHTMQHWHIYRKWNESFFVECFQAYKAGRGGDTNPADGWYKGELGFFDFYIIPLAKKLKDCGVFGVSSDEYLQYAQKNRQEWETRGQEIVASMVEKVNGGDVSLLEM